MGMHDSCGAQYSSIAGTLSVYCRVLHLDFQATSIFDSGIHMFASYFSRISDPNGELHGSISNLPGERLGAKNTAALFGN